MKIRKPYHYKLQMYTCRVFSIFILFSGIKYKSIHFFLQIKVQKSFISVRKPIAICVDLSQQNAEKCFHLPKPNHSLNVFFFRCVLPPIFHSRKKNYILISEKRPVIFVAVVVVGSYPSLLLLLVAFENVLCVYLSFG